MTSGFLRLSYFYEMNWKNTLAYILLLTQPVIVWAADEYEDTDSDYGNIGLIFVSVVLIIGILLLAFWKRHKDRF